MKKIYCLLFAFTIVSGIAFAQEATVTTTTTTTSSDGVLKSKRGFAILPEADEWGLGVSAQPFFQYFGNFFQGGALNASPNFTYGSNIANSVAIYGKKMIDANSAYRVRFNFGTGPSITKASVNQDVLVPDVNAPKFVDDWRKTTNTNLLLALGKEFRRGKGRVQGVYGAEAVIGYSSSKVVYQYGNSINSNFNAATTNNFGDGNIVTAGAAGTAVARRTEVTAGQSLLVGVRGFIGVEYFIAPKISIGGEFGYMLSYKATGKNYIKTESWDGANNVVRTIKTESYTANPATTIGVGIDNLNASINLLFYF